MKEGALSRDPGCGYFPQRRIGVPEYPSIRNPGLAQERSFLPESFRRYPEQHNNLLSVPRKVGRRARLVFLGG
jgi:hypothetical protein